MKEMMKLAAEMTRVMSRYNISAEDMEAIIEANNGNVKTAIMVIETACRIINK